MDTKEDIKMEPDSVMQNSFKVGPNLIGSEKDPEPKMSNIQAKRRFMITDILNSAVENAKEQKGLDMRLLFPGVTRLGPMSHNHENYQKLHEHHDPDIEGDSDNDGDDDDQDDADDKGKIYHSQKNQLQKMNIENWFPPD